MDNDKPQNPTPSLTELMGAMAAAQAAQEPFFLGLLRGHLKKHPGFKYSVVAESGHGSEVSFLVLVMEVWEGWCAASTLELHAGPCRQCVLSPRAPRGSPPPAPRA